MRKGCDEGCPVLVAGNCEVADELLLGVKLFSADPDEYNEMLDLYGLLPEESSIKYITFGV